MSLLAILFWFCGQRFQLLWAKQDSIGTAHGTLAPHKLHKSWWNELWCMNMYDVYWLLLSQYEFNLVQFDEFDEDGQLLTAKQLLPATFFSLACTLLRALKLRASWGSAYAWRLSRFFIPFSVVSHHNFIQFPQASSTAQKAARVFLNRKNVLPQTSLTDNII